MGEPFVDSEGYYAHYDEYLGLKIGDIVQLKSGGPEMTVAKISKSADSPDSEIEAECVWLNLALAPTMANKRMKAIRFSIINIPGRIIKRSRSLFLRLSKNHPSIIFWLQHAEE